MYQPISTTSSLKFSRTLWEQLAKQQRNGKFTNCLTLGIHSGWKDNITFFLLFSCRIFKTKDDITIKISDRGGGMSRRVRRKIFNYMYSTAPKVDCNLHEHSNSSDALKVVLPNSGGSYGGGLAAAQLPMHGLGYGLPLSRLYARWAAVLKFHHRFLLPSLPGTLWVISNWQAWTGLERTPTFTFRYS